MSIFRRIFETLREYYETKPPQIWWPEDPLEVVVGAVLVQGTNWKSVSGVLETLRERNLLDFRRLRETDDDELATLIRPVGFQAKKTRRLKELAELFLARSGGDTASFFARDPETIRRELLTVSGIGPGTADNMLLYAGKIPVYMVDPFTRRILVRHEIVDGKAKDADIQDLVHRELTPDEEPYGTRLFGDFQALIVRIGRDYCDKSSPACGRCPLAPFLPSNGPRDIEIRTTGPSRRDRPSDAAPPAVVGPTRSNPEARPVSTPKPIEELGLDDTERKIVERIDSEPVSIDVIVQTTGLPVHLVRATIAILEMRKIVRQVEGNNVRRVV